MSNTTKSFEILISSLKSYINYFEDLTKLFFHLYLSKFVDTSEKFSFSVLNKYKLLKKNVAKKKILESKKKFINYSKQNK